jgi:hypothetical protein
MSKANKEKDELSLEDLDLELNEEISLDPLSDDDDEIIELTDRLESLGGGDAKEALALETEEPISLETQALAKEEEEIIELVDAIERQTPGDEEILELTDAVVEKPVEAAGGSVEQEPSEDEQALELTDAVMEEPIEIDRFPASEEAERIVLKEEAAAGEPIELELPEEGLSVFGADELSQDVGRPFETPESTAQAPFVEEPMLETPDTGVPVMEEPLMGEPAVVEKAETGPAGTESVTGLSEEKVEEIITRVVTDILERKADKILLEVAEAAIQKEIEKIKSLL